MNLGEVLFLCMIFVTMAGALVTVLSGSIIYALLGLVATMFGIAGLYVYLNAPFLAMMQILIYVGAISVLIAFAIMLAGPFTKKPKDWSYPLKFVGAIVVSAFSFIFFFGVVMRTPWVKSQPVEFAATTKDIGRTFFDTLILPFELISLLIVVAIIGSIMLAMFSRGEK